MWGPHHSADLEAEYFHLKYFGANAGDGSAQIFPRMRSERDVSGETALQGLQIVRLVDVAPFREEGSPDAERARSLHRAREHLVRAPGDVNKNFRDEPLHPDEVIAPVRRRAERDLRPIHDSLDFSKRSE